MLLRLVSGHYEAIDEERRGIVQSMRLMADEARALAHEAREQILQAGSRHGLRRAALSTSGDTFQRLEIDGKRYSHIIDPHTGIELTDQSLVSVIARNCTASDGLATALSVLGPGPGLKLIENEPAGAARMIRLVDGKREAVESSRFSGFCEPLQTP